MTAANPARVIAAARAWLGAPYRHQASALGAGCDCLGLARGVWRALYGPDPTLQFSLIVGYENNRFAFTEDKGAVYGGGVSWHPSDRTQLDATAEHRFFGVGYNFTFNHRWPLSAFSIRASRDTNNYPQQLANLPTGAAGPFRSDVPREPVIIEKMTVVPAKK